MSEQQKAQQNNKNRNQTVFNNLMKFSLNLTILTILAWLFLVIWYALRLTFHASLAVVEVERLLKCMIDYMSCSHSFITRACINELQIMNTFLNETYIFIDHMIMAFSNYLPNSMISSSRVVSHSSIVLIISTAEIIFSRLVLFAMNTPLLIGLCFVLVVDGLGQRDIRKFSGSRESTFFFHKLKPMVTNLFYLMFFTFLSSPTVISPNGLLVTISLLLGLMTMMTIKSYKKYL